MTKVKALLREIKISKTFIGKGLDFVFLQIDIQALKLFIYVNYGRSLNYIMHKKVKFIYIYIII